jgi:polyisoprenoid-binding protein YceI
MKRACWISLAAVLVSSSAHAAQFVVKAGAPNKVVFTSKAATETFEGKTDRIDGRIVVDPASVEDTVVVHLEVDMASLDTGIGERNKHMKKNHLETDKYPKAVFAGATLLGPEGAALAEGKTVAFDCEGNFTLHGVTRRLRVTVEATLANERTLSFKTSFKVPLVDYNISRPKFLFLKLGEVQDVVVEGVATLSP